ncbi:hypothetical protein NIES2104_38480 [Leptolyngbya sp. NIES-2104]|nr:hypothetical protein NIES2104_38480 [Leptolyngbya sp. NIES-2104]
MRSPNSGIPELGDPLTAKLRSKKDADRLRTDTQITEK